jgi:hypothetical protein
MVRGSVKSARCSAEMRASRSVRRTEQKTALTWSALMWATQLASCLARQTEPQWSASLLMAEQLALPLRVRRSVLPSGQRLAQPLGPVCLGLQSVAVTHTWTDQSGT